jgi:hypothetical protein
MDATDAGVGPYVARRSRCSNGSWAGDTFPAAEAVGSRSIPDATPAAATAAAPAPAERRNPRRDTSSGTEEALGAIESGIGRERSVS